MSKVGKNERKVYNAIFSKARGFDEHGEPVPISGGEHIIVSFLARNGSEAAGFAYMHEEGENRHGASIYFTGIVYRAPKDGDGCFHINVVR